MRFQVCAMLLSAGLLPSCIEDGTQRVGQDCWEQVDCFEGLVCDDDLICAYAAHSQASGAACQKDRDCALGLGCILEICDASGAGSGGGGGGGGGGLVCNDGTISSTCTTCSSGCCSDHGGCDDGPGCGGTILCNDGTCSSSCTTCTTGCCSGHEGCM